MLGAGYLFWMLPFCDSAAPRVIAGALAMLIGVGVAADGGQTWADGARSDTHLFNAPTRVVSLALLHCLGTNSQKSAIYSLCIVN